ncbi:glycoside hydrolase superfamily, partial [Mycena leptocephala]
IGCNLFSPEDSANFLAFLQMLRNTESGEGLLLTAAVGIQPFLDSSQPPIPMTNVSEFASVLDRIEIMSYDIWGAWSTAVGPNAPLDDTCELLVNQQGSAASAVAVWTKAGFTADQVGPQYRQTLMPCGSHVTHITLGVASYGRSYRVSSVPALLDQKILPFPEFNSTDPPPGPEDDPSYIDTCGKHTGVNGEFTFNELISAGFLVSNGTQASGIYYTLGSCSKTPYVYDSSLNTMVSYDDARSFAAKSEFISQLGLAGFAMWDLAGDHNDILLDAI